MPERIEVAGLNGPVFVEITDAQLAEHGRVAAIAAATASLAPASGHQREPLNKTRDTK